MIFTINPIVKQKLQAIAYDCDYLIMTQLVTFFAPQGETEFMKLIKEYYSLRYEDFDFMISYFTQIKTLEERIRGINVILDDDKQTLLCFDMTLPESLQYYIKIWVMTLGMIADKVRSMFLKEERRLEKDKNQETLYGGAFAAIRSPDKRTSSRKVKDAKKCSRCGKPHDEEIC